MRLPTATHLLAGTKIDKVVYSTTMSRVYEEIIDFLAAGTTPSKIVAFEPSAEAKARVNEMIQREKTTGLSVEENSELAQYLQLEHLMRLAKARARAHLAHDQLH